MFGLSFGEVILLALIAMIVVGPRNLPTMLRTLGKTVSKLKRMTAEIREQTGIDDILKAEGIEKEMEQLRMIASGRVLDVDLDSDPADEHPPRYREYPRVGVDSYDAIPEDAAPYVPSEHVAPETANAAPGDDPYAGPDSAREAVPSADPAANAPAQPAAATPSEGAASDPPAKRVRISTVPDAPVSRSGSRASLPNDPFDKPIFDAPEATADASVKPIVGPPRPGSPA